MEYIRNIEGRVGGWGTRRNSPGQIHRTVGPTVEATQTLVTETATS